MILSPWRTGAAFGAILGLWHLAWSAAVAFGVAQAILDFVLWIHFIDLPARIAPFSPGRAGILVATTAVIGFGLGWLFAVIWNGLRKGT
jgi:hypothetical protein